MKDALLAAASAAALGTAPAAAAQTNPLMAAPTAQPQIPSEAGASLGALRQALAHCLKVHGRPAPDDEDGWHGHYACADRLVAKWRAAVARALDEGRRADREAERRAAARPAWMRRGAPRAVRL